MQYFLFRFLKLVIVPIIVILSFVFFWDPFKVFFSYEDYYTNNSITGNREDLCFRLLNKNNDNVYSNFIVGSSRSQAFKTNYWSKKISQNPNTCFHYDGSSMGLYRSRNAIKYLVSKTQKLDNLLLIVDTDFFSELNNPKSHLGIQHPEVSKESKFIYYWTFLKASMNAKFIFYNFLYKVTGKYFDFMGQHISKSRNYHVSNNLTADIWYAYDKEIESDSSLYYNNLIKKGVFYKRPEGENASIRLIHSNQYNLLKEIKKVVDENHANIKIVISPMYNQLRFNYFDKEILWGLFGRNNVFDFSGKNSFTSDYTNYYESSHFKPYIANKIMDSIYGTNNPVDSLQTHKIK